MTKILEPIQAPNLAIFLAIINSIGCVLMASTFPVHLIMDAVFDKIDGVAILISGVIQFYIGLSMATTEHPYNKSKK